MIVKKLKFQCCIDRKPAMSTELPGFPFTVILSIYDILDLYAYIELKPNVQWKTVLTKGPCKDVV